MPRDCITVQAMRAAVYARISDDRQGRGLGVARQEKDCRALCATHGWEVVAVYVDNDISAFSGKTRPAYERMVRAMQDGVVDVVVAWHTDRLHRSPLELERWISVCEAGNIFAHTVMAGELDMSSSTGRMVARMLGAAARHESERKSERSLGKARQLAEYGEVGNGGHRPFGYASDRRSVVEDEAQVLREAYASVIAGASLRAICSDLRDRGVTTTQGNPWSVQGLRYNLLSPRNVALREHRKVIVGPAVWDAIIDRPTWEIVRSILTDPTRKTSDREWGRRYLLSGFLRCGLCSGRLVATGMSHRALRFRCLPPKDGGCGHIMIRYDHTEAVVVETVLGRLRNNVDVTPDDPHDPTTDLLATIADAESRIVRLVEVFGSDGNALALRAATSAEERRISEARRKLVRQAQPPAAAPRDVADTWPTLDLEQRRAVLSLTLERIDVAPARPGNAFQPERLTIVWR